MISIITPIYDIDSHLKGFINAISYLQKGLKKNSKIGILEEVILINNNTKRDINKVINADDLKKIPELRIIQNKKNAGYGAACNQGMKKAIGRCMLVLNPDVRIDADSLVKLKDIMEKNGKANIISCKLLNEDGSLQYSCKRFPTLKALLARKIKFPFAYIFKKHLDRFIMKDYDHKKPRKVDWIAGAFMLMRNKYYFDDRYFLYFEDVDLCRRIGNVYYYPSVSAVHKAERQSAKDFKLFFFHIASMMRYFCKFAGKAGKKPSRNKDGKCHKLFKGAQLVFLKM